VSSNILAMHHHCLDSADDLDMRQHLEQLQQQLKDSQELTSVYFSLLQKVAQELRRPISNLHITIQMLEESPSEVLEECDRIILENECIRAIAVLNELSNIQELLKSSRIPVLQQLLVGDAE
jgi:signal transduction histidine kinase